MPVRIRGSAVALAVAATAGAIAIAVTGPAEALDNGLGHTPAMGFNNWNAVECKVTEAFMKKTADFIHGHAIGGTTLQRLGYQYVNIDDCWAAPQRDSNGNLTPNRSKFPSGIDGLAGYVHGLGLKLGVYADSGTRTCNGTGGFP